MTRPVVLLTFANDRYGPTTGYLRDLIGEQRAIKAAFDGSPIELVTQANITVDELFDLFTRYGRRLVVWHHGGHAEADAIFLEDGEGRPRAAGIGGLARRIGQLRRLALMTLNGCSTAGQVETLRAHSRAVIVATDHAVVDTAARAFAERFYRDLVADRSICEAFDSAVGRVEADWQGPTRMLRPAERPPNGSPWRLHIDTRRADGGGWRLSHAHRWTARDPRSWVIGAGIVATAAWIAWPPPVPVSTPPIIEQGPRGVIVDAMVETRGGTPDATQDAVRDAYVLPDPISPFDGGQPAPAAPHRPAAVWIPGGVTPLGRPPGRVPHASPRRNVEIPRPLWVMVTPVTRAHYADAMGAVPPTPGFLSAAPRAPSQHAPVTGITVAEAEAYAEAISTRDGLSPPHRWRLPTEDEWEYLCRAGGPTDDAGPVAPESETLPVVGGPPNAWQIRDLLGVVYQWTATPFPPDAEQSTERVRLGGHHLTRRGATLRCSYRDSAPAEFRDTFTGARLVRTAEPGP